MAAKISKKRSRQTKSKRLKTPMVLVFVLAFGAIGVWALRAGLAATWNGVCVSGTKGFSVSGPSYDPAQPGKRILSFAMYPPYPSGDPNIYAGAPNPAWQGAWVPFTHSTNGQQFRWYTYTENGGGGGVYRGTAQCTDKIAPTAPPSLNVATSVNSATLTWGASTDTSGVTSYSAYRNGSQVGSTNATNRTLALSSHPAGAFTFSVKAHDAAGNISAATNKAATVPSPPTPPTTTPNQPSKPATNVSKPPALQGSGTANQPNASMADKTPPSTPANLQASVDEDRPVVSLGWESSTDNTVVTSYQLERSTDQQNWQELARELSDTFFTDTDTSFQTRYYYRVRAFDGAGNVSEPAMVDVTTLVFKANVTKQNGGSLTSSDQVASVNVPPESVSEDASCSVEASSELASSPKGYVVLYGPYELVCRTATSNLPAFTVSPIVTINTSNQDRKNYASFSIHVGADGEWREAGSDPQSISLEDATNFVVFGREKITPLWLKIIFIVLAIAAIVVAFLGFRYWQYRKRQKDVYDDYYRKSHGY